MAITSISQINKLTIVLATDSPFDAEIIIARTTHGDGEVSFETYNFDTDSELEVCYEYYQATGAFIAYSTANGTYYGYDLLPLNLQFLANTACPFQRRLQNEASQQQVTQTGPHPRTWYKRGATIPALPSFASPPSDDDGAASIMTAGGWSSPDIPTGTDPLYWTIAQWGIEDGAPYMNATAPSGSQNIQWSTDGGDSFTTTAPANGEDIDVIRIFQPAIADWVEVTIRDEEITNPFVLLTGDNLQNHGSGSIAAQTQQLIDVSGEAILQDNYQVGFFFGNFSSWSNANSYKYSGSAGEFTDLLKLCTPAEYAARDSEQRVTDKTYLFEIEKSTGFARFSQMDSNTSVTSFSSAAWAVLQVLFIGYPKSVLTAASQTADTTVYVQHKDGIAVGDVLYIDDEQMLVTAINQTVDTVHGGYAMTVTRGANGTTAAAHADGAEVRAIVNRDEVRYVGIVNRNGVPQQSKMRVWRLRKRGAE